MPMMMTGECPCCGKFARTGDMHHCQDCWERFHNGLRDKDWEDRETFEKNHPVKLGRGWCEPEIKRIYEERSEEDLELVRQFKPLTARMWKKMHGDD